MEGRKRLDSGKAMKLRQYQLIEHGILARLKAEWIRSGTDLSFSEWYLMDKNIKTRRTGVKSKQMR
jgi:hypothetical protein